jgi:hypothetical protein
MRQALHQARSSPQVPIPASRMPDVGSTPGTERMLTAALEFYRATLEQGGLPAPRG